MNILLDAAFNSVLHMNILLLNSQSQPKSPLTLYSKLDLVEQNLTFSSSPHFIVGVAEWARERCYLLDTVGTYLLVDTIFAE